MKVNGKMILDMEKEFFITMKEIDMKEILKKEIEKDLENYFMVMEIGMKENLEIM